MPSADDFLDGKVLPQRASADEFLDSTPPKTVSSGPSPYQLPPVKPDQEDKPGMAQWMKTGKMPWDYSPAAKSAAAQGVDVTSGGPYGMRSRMDLARTADEELRAVEQSGYKSRFGPDSGKIEFFNPDTKRWTTVRSMNPTGGQAPTLPEVGKTAVLAAAGAIAPEGVLPMIGTQAAAGTAAEAGERLTSAMLGIKKGLGTEDIKSSLLEGAKQGAWATAGAAVSGGLPLLYKYARYGPDLFKTPVFNTKYWPDMQRDMLAAQNDLEDYYALAGNRNLKLDTEQLSGHPAAHVSLEDSRKTLKEAAVDYAIRGQDNLSNLQQTFDEVTKGIIGPEPVDPLSSGQAISQWQQEQKAAWLAQQQLMEKTSTDAAKRAINGLPEMSQDQINQRITEQLQLVNQQEKAQVDKAWGDVAVQFGKPPSVAYAKDSTWLSEPQQQSIAYPVSSEVENKLLNLLKEAKGAYAVDSDAAIAKIRAIPDGILKTSPVKEPLPGVSPSLSPEDTQLLKEFGQTVPSETSASPKHVVIGNTRYSIDTSPKDAYWVVNAIKGLRSGVRQDMARSKGWLPPESQDTARVAETLSTDLKQFLSGPHPEALAALEAAEQQSKEFASRWRDSVLSEAAKKYDGFSQYPLSAAVNNAIFKSGVNGDKTALRELAQISKGDPKFEDSIRQSIFAWYRSQYTKNGVPTPDLHEKFLNDMAGPIEAFFSPAEQAQIEHLGNLGDIVARRSADVAKFDKLWKASPYADIPANSTLLAKAGFSNANSVRGLGTFLRQNNPALLKELQRDTAQQLAQRVKGLSGSRFSVPALDRALDPVLGKNFQDIMPPEYVQGLRTISNTAHRLTGSPGIYNPAEESLAIKTMRLFVGTLSKEGRAFTLFKGFREKQAARLIDSVVSDPEKMKMFMALKDQSPRVAAKAGFLTSVGASGLDQESTLSP